MQTRARRGPCRSREAARPHRTLDPSDHQSREAAEKIKDQRSTIFFEFLTALIFAMRPFPL